MNYQEADQKKILREMQSDLLAMVAVNPDDGTYEVIYSDGAYKQYGNRFRGTDFFDAWKNAGKQLIFEQDQKRMFSEISGEYLWKQLSENDSYITKCRFYIKDAPEWCRIKVIRNPVEPGTLVIGIRNIDAELRQELDHMAEVEEMLRRETIYRKTMKELQDTLTQMRVKNSVSQIHPHFLYNALGSIREIVLTDPEYGADMLYDFTTHLRASIRAMSGDSKIWFSQELESIRAYVNIEKMRFGDRLDVIYEIGTPDFMIIPLSVQPVVENAIKHGLYESEKDDGTVLIRTRELADAWEVCVRDDGSGFDPQEIRGEILAGRRDSTGLENLIFRLENMMHASVRVESRAGEGTTVTIRIPKNIPE